ncbi:MAG: hypothetical protein Q8L54_11365 [Devosia sp.]|nr:hypothetical protein [Devosia sp.]
MGQGLHGSATTTEAVRRAIQNSQESLSVRLVAASIGVTKSVSGPVPVERHVMRLVGSLLLSLIAAGPIAAQGTEILADEKWYQLEETVFAYELGAMAAMGEEAARCMVAESARWAAAMESGVPSDRAREMAYLDRIASLHYLQPAAARVIGLALPKAPELIAVIAPEDDEAGSPKDFDTRTEYFVSGPLRQEFDDPEHMGLVVESGLGPHAFVFLMELGNQPAHEVLLSLAQADPEQKYIVRGNRQDAADGIPNLRTDQCRWVYRAAQ